MKGQDLIAQANRLVRASTNKPRRADLNRAVSAAYYALFLTLARLCADTIAGTGKNRNIAAWQQAYRALDHGFAKEACKKVPNKRLPPEIIRFASVFVELQEARHDADYNPSRTFRRAEVIPLIQKAERAIIDLGDAPRVDLRALVVLVLLKDRK